MLFAENYAAKEDIWSKRAEDTDSSVTMAQRNKKTMIVFIERIKEI